MKMHLFFGEELMIPANCYFIARGGHENDFTCPVEGDRFRGISFPLVEEEIKRINLKSKEEWNKDFSEKNLDILITEDKQKTIDDRKHHLRIWEMDGIVHHSYLVCDKRACISIFATESAFVRSLVEQFSTKILYDL
tara:strand:- start:3380 stop:3790 length:411 start_codon:yes stop_codon:yes gene_type:complete